MSWLSTLRGRLLLLVCLATLPAILFTFFVAEAERAAALERAEEDALHLAHLAGREHSNQIEGARALLLWLGRKLAQEGEGSPIITEPDYLPALLAGYPQLANIGVVSRDGRVLASAYPLPRFPNMGDNPAVAAALESADVATGTYVVGPIVHRPVVNLAYAVRGGEGDVRMIVFDAVGLEWLTAMAERIEVPRDVSLAITDRTDRVLAYSGAGDADAPSPAGLRIPGVAELSRARRGELLPVGGGQRRFFVAAPLGQGSDIFVAVGLSHDQILARANQAFYRTLAALVLLTVFTIVAVFVSAELAVLRRLRALAQIVRRFGRGDSGARARVTGGAHELAALGRAFNDMADSLVARHAEALEAENRLRALSARLQVARETEARRIARELHDEIGQVLTRLKIDISRLPSSCRPDRPQEECAAALRRGVDAAQEQVAAAVDLVRRLSSELRPGVLDQLGLASALEWQAREIEERTDLAVHVDAEEIDPPLDWLISVTLFRVAQEALTNVIRHAEATKVEITLRRSGGDVTLAVSDDGRGIPRDVVGSADSLGIVGMQERALLVGGRLSIRGETHRGTTVSVTVPLSPERERTDAPVAG